MLKSSTSPGDGSDASPTKEGSDRSGSPTLDAPPAYSPRTQMPVSQVDCFGDRQRTKARYQKAVKKLKESLKSAQADWKSFEIPDFENIPEDDPVSQLREEIKNMLGVPGKSENKKGWIERGFTAMSPFAKNFLRIAKEG